MHRLIPISARVIAIAGGVLAAGTATALACLPDLPSTVFSRHSSDQLRTVVRSCAGGRAPDVVRPGDCLAIAASGFDPKEAVVARLLSAASHPARLSADKSGSVIWRFTVSRSMSGKDVATFVGQGTPAGHGATSGNVTVSVPRFAVARYAVQAPARDDDHGHERGK